MRECSLNTHHSHPSLTLHPSQSTLSSHCHSSLSLITFFSHTPHTSHFILTLHTPHTHLSHLTLPLTLILTHPSCAVQSTRNTVPVPRHWCFKRKYLQGKRGIEKPPFNLPFFIKDTGVMEMRQALQEKEDEKTLKAKTRERVRGYLG